MRALNLGCGARPDGRGLIPTGAEIVNHDRWQHAPHVDVAHDLRLFPWPWADGEFDLIVAFDVLEHLPDTLATMDECWRILSPGGELWVHTNNIEHPAAAFRDPTHVRYFQYESFDFFDPETAWGRSYGRFYTTRHWQLLEKRRDACELFFRLRRRG